jgi:hypothetical protein
MRPEPPEVSDHELTALALAADPETLIDDDAEPLADVLRGEVPRLLPDWYMPAPMGGARPLRGWRRQVVVLVILSFLTITAAGLCNTYGQLHFG